MTIAMLFPGQGSQSQGMQSELALHFDEINSTYAEASDLLGYDLWALVQDGPKDELDATIVTQPAMLTAGVAAWRTWRKAGGNLPAFLAGHSLGEYTALVCAKALNFSDAIMLVRRRAELMQDAVPDGEGAMAAILGLDDEAVLDICENASGIGIAEAVNFNSPLQVVVAGQRPAVMRMIDLAREQGARHVIMLPVSVPSHSSLMRPAGDALMETLKATEFLPTEITVYSSVDAKPYGDADDIRNRLRRQIFSPVHWVKTIKVLIGEGADSFIECGPGRVLAGLCRRIDRSVPTIGLDNPVNLEKALQ